MSPILKSYDGLVGVSFPELGLYMTSPNMAVLIDPLVGPQNVRMRRQLHFGEHDPLLFPQPYDEKLPFLALCPLPLSTASLAPWNLPEESTFEPIPGQKLAPDPLGRLPLNLINALDEDFHRFEGHIQSPPRPLSSDLQSRAKGYFTRIRYLLTRLNTPMQYRGALLVLSLVQRCLLELEALETWAFDVEPTWGKASATKVPKTRDVVGALTDRPDIAEFLFRAGIPVWYLRKLGTEDTAKVLRWSTKESPVPSRRLAGSYVVDDEEPPYATAFTGSLQNPGRFRAMAEELWTRAFPSSIWRDDPQVERVFTNTSSSSLPAALPSCPPPTEKVPGSSSSHVAGSSETRMSPVAGPSRQQKHRPTKSKPYVKPEPQVIRNKFLEVQSVVVPTLARNWQDASEAVGAEFNHTINAREGVPRGYILPEPALFVTPKDESTRQHFFATYLRLREVLFARAGDLGNIQNLRSPEQWRTLLRTGLESHNKQNTKAARQRNKMRESVASGNLELPTSEQINLDDLQSVPLVWCGQSCPYPLPDHVCRALLYDIFATSFCAELLIADRFFYELKTSRKDGDKYNDLDAETRVERNTKILAAIPNMLQEGTLGLVSSNDVVLQESIYALYRVMAGWTRSMTMHHAIHDATKPLQPGSTPSASELATAEYRVAWFYIYAFSQFFRRAPVLPHRR